MRNNRVTGNIENTDSGKVTVYNHYLFCGGFELNTFVRIEHVEEYSHPDNTIQISVDCLAVDSYGFIFELELHFDFEPDQTVDKNKVLSDITLGAILSIKGQYGIIEEEGIFTIYDPQYCELPPDFLITEIEKVFIHNCNQKKKRENNRHAC